MPKDWRRSRKADVILSLDWVDLAGTLKAAKRRPTPRSSASRSTITLHNGWSMDHQGFAPVDLMLAADPEHAVPLLVEALGRRAQAAPPPRIAPMQSPAGGPAHGRASRARAARRRSATAPCSLTHLPLSWNGAWWPFRHPLDFLGSDGGGGLGAGPGISVGAALALQGLRPPAGRRSAATATS